MTVFVTGASGYIGQSVLRALAARGETVVALARSDRAEQIVGELGARPVRGELTDAALLRAQAAAADGVIHLGAVDGATDRAAAEAMLAGASGRPYVHTGGVWVYGDTAGLVDEEAPLAPPALVAWRVDVERYVLRQPGHPVLIRPGVVYGRSAWLLEQAFGADARATGSVRVIGEGANHMTLVHVDDLAELYVLALLRAPAGAVYNAVTQNLPLRAVAEALSRSLGLGGKTRPVAAEALGPLGEAFALEQQVSSERAIRELGWQPAHVDALRELAAG
ncbi:NAD-dependent epimerase/dehydratase family protein [Nannocystis punicea]|uniref:NAD-dependent epimerase/dehydratase family protein n=1 Tax=Nannocystis punicea TaxID=2995304 RepID=A0ABY7HC17_9BACT|nr:NAD-dependent epimerase/dehydratase family protein [Nannocystis poenicansa]WAS96574.1 NAD-dependent epimerase/dehydratase family protein [Nannocystis poenicansa]